MSETINNHQVFSLKEVMTSVQKTLAKRYTKSYWIKAEMNKLNYYSYSGHCYPDLLEKKDGKVVAQMRAMIWKGNFEQINHNFLKVLQEPLKDGINILFLAKIVFDPVHGLSLQILDIDPSYSLGILEQEKFQNIERLKKEGLFDKNKGLKLALLPKRIAIISVETSKGYADFLKILRQNNRGYQFETTLFPARLQGDLAINDIYRQLYKIGQNAEHFDVITIIRGGGGEVGLSAFNDYKLAKQIAISPIPVMTGIGHSTNETICEMVAFRNAITPTECAQFMIDRFRSFELNLQKTWQRIASLTNFRLNHQKEQERFILKMLGTNIKRIFNRKQEKQLEAKESIANSAKLLLEQQRESGQINFDRLKTTVNLLFEKQEKELTQLERSISLVDPKMVLKRGFSITRYQGKTILPGDALPEEGGEIETELLNGTLNSVIIKKNEK